jgi:hypothetical protein
MNVERLGRQAEPKQRSCLDLRNEKMTTLHVRCRPKEEQWGSRKRGGGKEGIYTCFDPQGDTYKETEEQMGC